MAYVLTYVCKWCGASVATFPNVPAHEPATLTVCDRPECRAQASTDWRGSVTHGR